MHVPAVNPWAGNHTPATPIQMASEVSPDMGPGEPATARNKQRHIPHGHHAGDISPEEGSGSNEGSVQKFTYSFGEEEKEFSIFEGILNMTEQETHQEIFGDFSAGAVTAGGSGNAPSDRDPPMGLEQYANAYN